LGADRTLPGASEYTRPQPPTLIRAPSYPKKEL